MALGDGGHCLTWEQEDDSGPVYAPSVEVEVDSYRRKEYHPELVKASRGLGHEIAFQGRAVQARCPFPKGTPEPGSCCEVLEDRHSTTGRQVAPSSEF